jgi:putative phage-type endonuclease
MITEQQRLERMNGIGGSDAPILLGLSPYKTAYQLYLEKVGEVEPDNLDGVEVIQWGNILEDVVADEFSRRAGLTLHRVNRSLVHPSHPFMRANLDRRVVGKPELCEIKTVRGLDGDAARADHVAQVQHYLAVTGYDRAHLVYLVSGQRMLNFTVERDDAYIADMIEVERTFWNHVTTRTAPPPQTVADLRAAFPRDIGQAVAADDITVATVERLRLLTAQRKALETEEEQAQADILKAMGEASELINADGRTLATWKTAKPTRTFDRTRFELDHPDLAVGYLVEKPGSRRFLLKEVRT